jgi:hypothetical protein
VRCADLRGQPIYDFIELVETVRLQPGCTGADVMGRFETSSVAFTHWW